MKDILLLGDSIRQNYQDYVQKQLRSIANVYYTDDNGKFGYYTLRYLHEWIRALSKFNEIEFDIVHFNCGLWDILRLSSENRTFTAKEEYREILKRIVERIRFLCPKAKIVFALTTEVIEPGFESGIGVGERKNADIRIFNSVALEVCKELKIVVDDLWNISRALPQEAHSDMVHYDTDIGIKALGNQVVNCLRSVLEWVEIKE